MTEDIPVKRPPGRRKAVPGEEPVPVKRYRTDELKEETRLPVLDLCRMIGDMTGFTAYESRYFFEAFCAVIHYEILYGREVNLPSVGKIIPTIRKNYLTPNVFFPTKQEIPYVCHVRFKADRNLRAKMRDLPKTISKERLEKMKRKKEAWELAREKKKMEQAEDFI